MIRSASRTAARSLVQLRPPTAYPTLVTTRSYHENIVEHYESPRNVGSLPKDDEDVGTGLVGAPACGDVMKLQIRVNDDGTIEESKFNLWLRLGHRLELGGHGMDP